MAKLILHIHKLVISLVCLALIIIMMMSASHFIHRQQAEFSEQINSVVHQFIRQSTYSMGPLIHRYNTDVDDGQQINAILQHLAKHPWVTEVSVYQLNGELIAKTANSPESPSSAINPNTAKPSNIIELVEKIDLLENPIGFIKLTIDTNQLMPHQDSLSYTTRMIWLMMLLSTLTGIILVIALFTIKTREPSPDNEQHANNQVEKEI